MSTAAFSVLHAQCVLDHHVEGSHVAAKDDTRAWDRGCDVSSAMTVKSCSQFLSVRYCSENTMMAYIEEAQVKEHNGSHLLPDWILELMHCLQHQHYHNVLR